MAVTLNALTTGVGGLQTTGDTSGVIALQSNGSTMATISTSGYAYSDGSIQTAAASPYVLKNRIINGAMVIAQRGTGPFTSSGTTTYGADRWKAYDSTNVGKFTSQQSSTAPTGYTKSLLITSTSAYTSAATDVLTVYQPIEGFNTADLGWGAAGASTVTLSFWVRSSLTGSFGGSLQNAAQSRNYPISYTINAANTWEQKTITIPGDTTGTWATDNSIGIAVVFNIGTGSTYAAAANSWTATNYITTATGTQNLTATNGATLYITGVQLEIGTSATPFERRLYNQELANCQRYYEKSYDQSVVPGTSSTNGRPGCISSNFTSTNYFNPGPLFKVTKRTAPTVNLYSPAGTLGKLYNTSDVDTGAGIVAANIGDNGIGYFVATVSSVSALGTFSFQFTASAEL